jgi:radical SAM enzyme (TIGR01210 family)
MPTYPDTTTGRDRFVLERRAAKPLNDPFLHHGVTVDMEPAAGGGSIAVGAVFLTGRECPWRCVMCDLWRQTTDAATPRGAIGAQVHEARAMLAGRGDAPRHMKLYNAGSFFDPRAVPVEDYDQIAAALHGIAHVIVESHPSLVGDRTARFRDILEQHGVPSMEVAMGLETAHPDALEQLHKRMTPDDFVAAAGRLRSMNVAARVFLLISPPFVPPSEQDEWLARSVRLALQSDAAIISLIPTRSGNGALEALANDGLFHQPRLDDIERSLALALDVAREHGGKARVVADLWDLARFSGCPHCLETRRLRLERSNLEQRVQPTVTCAFCMVTTT